MGRRIMRSRAHLPLQLSGLSIASIINCCSLLNDTCLSFKQGLHALGMPACKMRWPSILHLLLQLCLVHNVSLTQNLTKRGHLYPHNYDALMQRLKETKTCYSLSFSATKFSTLPVLGGANPFTRGLLRHTCWTQCMFEVRRQATDYWLWNARDPCMMPGTGLCIKLLQANDLPLIEHADSPFGTIDLGPLYEMSPLSLQRCFCWANFQIQRIVNVTRIPSPNMSKAKPYKCDAKSVYERVARGANHYNGFTRDGWGVMSFDGKEELNVAANLTCEAHKYDCLCGAKGTYCSESRVSEPYIPAHYIPAYDKSDWS